MVRDAPAPLREEPRAPRATARVWLARGVLLALSLGLALAAAELYLRWSSGPAARTVPAAGKPAEGEGEGELFVHDPLLGWRPAPGAEMRQTSEEFDVAIRINSQGIRADREIPPEPPPGVRRIVGVGDSFVFGHGVELEESFLALLEEMLPGTETVNLGVQGHGTDQHLLMLESRGLRFQPDLVLLGLYTPEIERNAGTFHRLTPKPRFRLNDRGGLVLENVPVPREGEAFPAPPAGLAGRSRLLARAGTFLSRHGVGPVWEVTAAILQRMEASSAAAGAELLVVVIPPQYAVQGGAVERLSQRHTVGVVGGMLEDLGLEHVDVTPALEELARTRPGETLYFPRDGHLTPAGNRLVAREIADFLERR
jgi:hypothetical protein